MIGRARLATLVGDLGGRFVRRAAAKLQVGSLGLTAISFVASVLLARTLGPPLYGAYTLVMSAGTTIGLLRRLGQDYAATTQLAEGHGAGDRRKVRDALVFYVFMSVADVGGGAAAGDPAGALARPRASSGTQT